MRTALVFLGLIVAATACVRSAHQLRPARGAGIDGAAVEDAHGARSRASGGSGYEPVGKLEPTDHVAKGGRGAALDGAADGSPQESVSFDRIRRSH